MIDGLHKTVILVRNLSVKDTDQAIIATAEQEFSLSGMKV